MKIKVSLIVMMAMFVLGNFSFEAAANDISDIDEDQKFEGFNLQGYTDGGVKAWDLNGKTADVNGDVIEISNVDATRYGEQEMNLKAKTGVVNRTSGNIFLEEDVVITTKEGGTLETDSLDWDKENDLVKTEDYVVITDKDMMASGTGMEARPGLKKAHMKKDVTVKINTEPLKSDGRIVTITCDGPMEIDQQTNMATFSDNVVAISDDRTLKADRMEVHFDPFTNQIKETICIGNVRIVSGENTTLSERAVYNAITKKMTLSGRPKLIMATEDNDAMSAFK